ncbi:MAG: response regulator [Pleurocapsa sp.]
MSNKTILLVEDNPDDRELMRLAFSRSQVQHNLIVLSDGFEALDYLLRAGRYCDRENTLPALILLDLNLPKINGIEVLRRIRSHSQIQLLPVVIISSSDEPQDIIDSYINGCNSYVRKPIHFTQLQNFVTEISTYWLLVNQFPPVSGVPNE